MIVEDIPESGLHRDIDASAAVCAGVAALADVREVSRLSARFDLTFAPQPAGTVAEPKSATRKRAKPGEEPPEPLIDGTVDLGAIATEFLVLGIDPYPRKADVEFKPPQVAADAPHPFAGLEALKKSPGGGRR